MYKLLWVLRPPREGLAGISTTCSCLSSHFPFQSSCPCPCWPPHPDLTQPIYILLLHHHSLVHWQGGSPAPSRHAPWLFAAANWTCTFPGPTPPSYPSFWSLAASLWVQTSPLDLWVHSAPCHLSFVSHL